MSARSGITKALATGIASSLVGAGNYVTDVYGNVSTKVMHFDEINNFPYISVTAGPENREDLPSNISICTLTVYIRIYIENGSDPTEELESIISDIETFVDSNLDISYNVKIPQGTETRKTISNSIVSIDTDEGLLQPNALGEVVLDVTYEKLRQT